MSRILWTNSKLIYHHGHSLTQPDWPPLTPAYLAAVAGDKHEHKIIDQTDPLTPKNALLTAVKEWKPDILAYSIVAARDVWTSIRDIKAVLAIAPELLILAGGQGTHNLHKQMEDDSCPIMGVDVNTGRLIFDVGVDIIYGEAEQRISQEWGNGSLNGAISLDDCPIPRWDLMPYRKSHFFKGRYTGSIEMSRGCPFKCDFCAITSYWKGTFRSKSNQRIIEELKYLVSQGRSHIYLADDNFGMNAKKHTELFELILSAGLDIRLFAQMRTDTIANHPDMMKLASRAGLYGALIGFDTYDNDTMHHVSKVGSAELNEECARVCRESGVAVFGSHIFGLPGQDIVTNFWQTFKLGRRNSDIFRMPMFSLLPGTKAYGRLITQESLDGTAGSDDYRLPMRKGKELAKFKRWCTIYNLLHLALDWWKMLRCGMRGKFARADYMGAVRYWRGRIWSWIRGGNHGLCGRFR